MTGRPPPALWLPVAPLVVGAALRWHGLDWGLPDLFEEATPFFRAWGMWHWSDGSGVSFDPDFYRYPSLVFYVHWLVQAARVGAAWLSGGADAVRDVPVDFLADRTSVLFAARTVGGALGVALIAGTYALGRRLAGATAGFTAATAVAVSGFLVEQSQFIEVDVASACFATWALWAGVAIVQEGRLRDCALAGVFAGLATSAKYPGAFAFVPLLGAHAVRLGRAARDRTSARAPWLGVALTGLCGLGAFALTSPYVLIHLDRAWADVAAEREHMELGHFGVAQGPAYAEYARDLFFRILGPVGVLAALAGIVLAVRRRYAGALLVALFALVYLGVVGSWTMRADRYLALVAPALWALAAIPVAELATRRRRRAVTAGIALAVSAAWSLPGAYARIGPDTRTLARGWIETKVPPGAFLLMEGWGPDLFKPSDLWVDLSVEARRRTVERTKRPLYCVQFLPMHQTAPETSEAFYDLALYDDVDVIVLCSQIGDRYRQEPDRFGRQLRFYDDVAATFAHVAEFDSTVGPGPRISVFARPSVARTFSRRETQVGPRPLRYGWRRTAEGEASWFQHLGLNYETFGFGDEALRAYLAALEPPSLGSALAVRVGMGLARVYLRRGDAAAAEGALRRAAERASRAEDRARLLSMAAEVRPSS